MKYFPITFFSILFSSNPAAVSGFASKNHAFVNKLQKANTILNRVPGRSVDVRLTAHVMNDDDENSVQAKLSKNLNTMERAFGKDNYQLSSKVAIAVGVGYFLIKIVRARIMKRGKNVLSAMPSWGYLVSSKEEEMEFLHAYCCKQCGTTIFPARGRDAKFFPKDIECFACGAKGRENFYDRRKDMDIGDDVDYLTPYDYMSDAEKKIAKLKEENERMAELAKKRAEEDAWLDELTEESDESEENEDNEDDLESEDSESEENSSSDLGDLLGME